MDDLTVQNPKPMLKLLSNYPRSKKLEMFGKRLNDG